MRLKIRCDGKSTVLLQNFLEPNWAIVWLHLFCRALMPFTYEYAEIFLTVLHVRSRGLKGHSPLQPSRQMGPCRVTARLAGPLGPSTCF
jgi:hypothetical protein